ncbi:MAG: catalase/peroxidase HPI [Ilumatobacter sp.]|uniref:catalase/peroxidase HPI n=1 Tax=Ilumatobacter sp. TaxID=1967498 RepID=UPI0032990540
MSNESDVWEINDSDATGCPVMHGPSAAHTAKGFTAAQHWWPNALDLRMLHQGHPASNPLGDDFDYSEAFLALDYQALKSDLADLMTDSQDYWPADYGHYGPFFVRMAWHAAGTYRIEDGRGGGGTGARRFAPLNSWPDNGNLDKARALLQTIKQKYGNSISWADLLLLTGNVAMETMGFETFGFGGGRADIWAPEDDIYWGPETEWLGSERTDAQGNLDKPLGAAHMGLIYVNPEGPMGKSDPLGTARLIRETFSRMAMNDEETVALTVGGHTFGKAHGAGDAEVHVGPEPEGAPIEQMGLGWKNSFGSGVGTDTITSGIEGAWTATPIQWDNSYLETLLNNEWELTTSPAGASQWKPVGDALANTVPDAATGELKFQPMMTDADMAMKVDPVYAEICQRFLENPDELADKFARAWFKLLHRDMGPKVRYLGPEVPDEVLIWQDPVEQGTELSDADVATLKGQIMDSGLLISELVATAWASASTYRDSDKRGGSDGARVRLEPQITWDVNQPDQLRRVLGKLEEIQSNFSGTVSMADLIVLGGAAAVEAAAKAAGHDVTVPVSTGRGDATAEMTDIDSFEPLEPTYDGFRNFEGKGATLPPEKILVDRAQLLTLSAPEMTVLVGGLRVLGANTGGTTHGVLTDRTEVLSNDFFTNILDLGVTWAPTNDTESVFEATDRASGSVKWTATRCDLIFGANSQLRAISEIYGQAGSEAKFVKDFAAAFTKVMELGNF